MADISMSYGVVTELEEKAAFLQGGMDEFIKDFEKLSGEIVNGWDGKAKTDFAAKCDAVIPLMTAISDVLGMYKEAISQAVYLQQSTESSSAASAEQLSF